jgi:DNA processing protein
MENDDALLVLARCGAGAATLRALLDAAQSPAHALAAGEPAWQAAGLDLAACAALHSPDHRQLDSDRAWLQASPRHRLLAWSSPDYPSLLRAAPSPPALLFLVGDAELLWHPQVAIVGSRRPSAGGIENARAFARSFGLAGLAVTSGLAAGIDAAAHLGAMESFRTIAVLGSGPDRCYPPGNAVLMERIAAEGVLLSEHPPGTAAIAEHFPSRNRLVASLSLGTVVVEAALRSGALITARLAAEAGREVFALPGSIHNPLARGCHRLIRQGAALAETPEEVIEALAPIAEGLAENLRGRLAETGGNPDAGGESTWATGTDVGSPEESLLWRSLAHDPVTLDQLCARTGLTVGPLSAMLLAMELNGKISLAHGRYSRRS